MKTMIKTVVVAATLFAAASGAYAASIDGLRNPGAIEAVGEAYSATVLKVNAGEASQLKFSNDVAALQSRIKSNSFLARNVEAQGYTIDQIVGATGFDTGLTLYAL